MTNNMCFAPLDPLLIFYVFYQCNKNLKAFLVLRVIAESMAQASAADA